MRREGRTFDECGAKFWRQWQRLGELDAFRFPIEAMPFDELDEFMGFEVFRGVGREGTIGEYPEKHDIRLAKKALGDLWRYVEMALDTEDGSIYSLDSFDVDIQRIPQATGTPS